MLEGIRSYMPANDTTSIGSIKYSNDARLRLAKESVNFVCPNCGPVKNICQKMMAAKSTKPGIVHRIKKVVGEEAKENKKEKVEEPEKKKKEELKAKEEEPALKAEAPKLEEKKEEVKPPKKKKVRGELSEKAKGRIRKVLRDELKKRIRMLLIITLGIFIFFSRKYFLTFFGC
eukprot:TRINITY_DN7840_c0_g3_i3.p2 TRINITY_DN7840_c0_g3~~TRINITY_DN7840_c0_g3_i3.p2  ORF type:complete len:174 (+),score=39.62 TRINITY_DN7840_c0_g3_i3:546-1067(+)